MEMEEKIRMAMENTEILLQPKKLLSTYESTTVKYYILTNPFYLEFEGKKQDDETVIREGRITWQKPKLITPYYIMRMEGFSEEAKKAFMIAAGENADIAMMLYKMKFIKDYDHMEIVNDSLENVTHRIESDIEKYNDMFSAIIKGVDEFWDVSLTKFVYELIVNSAYYSHLPEFNKNSMINYDMNGLPVIAKDYNGIPFMAKKEIENLFIMYKNGEIDAKHLKDEIDSWGLFDYYQDRFLSLFRKNR
ncbi:MAG: hypothetical protein JW997_00545 [Actinobacteria bacterium]|nr:hypothetical protein [Actinomycetota bacterium]